jgi:hypothetical protein
MSISLSNKPFIFVSLALLLSSCASHFSKRYWEEYYTKKAALFSAELAAHGIEIECFKYENKRWPENFSEMIIYEPTVLPCFGFVHQGDNFWQKSPGAIVQGIDEENALIIINELRDKQGSLKTLEQVIHINYHIEYERDFTRITE